MTKKFTEEQYQKIVEMFEEADKEYNMGLLNPNVVVFFQDKLYREFDAVVYFIEDWQPIVAIANPLTREWAHDKFVEKEKKYVWQSKQETDGGKVKRLYDSAIGITDSFKEKKEPIHNSNLITETEVKKWGYDPSKFTRIAIKGDS